MNQTITLFFRNIGYEFAKFALAAVRYLVDEDPAGVGESQIDLAPIDLVASPGDEALSNEPVAHAASRWRG